MEKQNTELKLLQEEEEKLNHEAFQVKVKLSYNKKRQKLINEEIKALNQVSK